MLRDFELSVYTKNGGKIAITQYTSNLQCIPLKLSKLEKIKLKKAGNTKKIKNFLTYLKKRAMYV